MNGLVFKKSPKTCITINIKELVGTQQVRIYIINIALGRHILRWRPTIIKNCKTHFEFERKIMEGLP